MLLIQDVNVSANSQISLNHESEVQWDKEAFMNVGHIQNLIQDNNEELLAVIKSARHLFKNASRNVPSPFMHNPALFNFNTDGETNYQGCMTDGGNVIVIQTITQIDERGFDVYQSIGYDGTRGRFIQELDWICREYFISEYSQLISERPTRYDSTGPDDMLVYECATTYSIRQYEMGNKEPLVYWVNEATKSAASGKAMSATSQSIVNYLKENDESFSNDWDAFIESVSVMDQLAIKLVHR